MEREEERSVAQLLECEQLLAEGKVKEAALLAEELALKFSSSSSEWLKTTSWLLGRVREAEGRKNEAIKHYEACAKEVSNMEKVRTMQERAMWRCACLCDDDEVALSYHQRGWDLFHDIDCGVQVAGDMAYGEGIKRDVGRAIAILNEILASNPARIEPNVILGDIFTLLEDFGAEWYDPQKGIAHYKMAADAGDGNAYGKLATIAIFGLKGVPPDDTEAVKWMKRAIEVRPLCQYFISLCTTLICFYERERGGLKRDEVEEHRLKMLILDAPLSMPGDKECVDKARFQVFLDFSKGQGTQRNSLKGVKQCRILARDAAELHVRQKAQHFLNEFDLCLGCSKKPSAVCSGCRVALYCGSQCQNAHWPQHKADCREIQAELKAKKK